MSRSPEPVDLLDWDDPVRGFITAEHEGRSLALRTSGTTQQPRRVIRSAGSWSSSFAAVSALAAVDQASRVWVPGPMTSTMNLFARVHAHAAGAEVVEDPSDATHAHLTPLALTRARRSRVLRRGATVIVAGDALAAGEVERATADGLRVHAYYGAAELSFVGWASDGLTYGAFPGVEIRIDNEEIWARSPYLCNGYAADDETGSLRWSTDGFATVGDRGEFHDGELRVRGRGDDAVTTAGVTVLVADVESVLRSCAAGPLRVVGLPDARLGSVVAVALTDPADLEVLPDVARHRLSPAQRPHRWYVLNSLPTSASGKPDSELLREVLAVTPAARVAR